MFVLFVGYELFMFVTFVWYEPFMFVTFVWYEPFMFVMFVRWPMSYSVSKYVLLSTECLCC